MILLCLWMTTPAVAQTVQVDAQAPLVCAPAITRVQVAQAVDGKRPEQGWQDARLPDHWNKRWPDYNGVVWYRIDWERGCVGPQRQDHPVALAVDWLNLAGQIFSNQDLLWRDPMLVEPYTRGWNMPRAWRLAESGLNEGSNTIWIAVHGVDLMSPGLGVVSLGSPEAMEAKLASRLWHQRTMLVINLTISAVLGCLFFCIWVLNRSQAAAGWYVLTTAFWILFASTLLVTNPPAWLSTTLSLRVSVSACLMFLGCYGVFTWRFCLARLPRAVVAVGVLQACLALLALILPAVILRQGLSCALVLAGMLFLLNTLALLIYGLRRREAEPIILATSGLLCIIIGVHDFWVSTLLLDWPPLLAYTSLLTLLTISMLLGRRIARNMRRIEQFNQELSQAVTQACEDLGATLAREHALALDNTLLQERLQVAQDLHDSLGGSLVRSIAVVEQARGPLDNARFLSMLKLLRNDLRQVIDSGAHIGLAGAGTPQELMAPLRHRYVNLFEELGFESKWEIPLAWRTPPGALVCLALTRLVEEALANVIKHSRASQVSIRLQLPQVDTLILRIEDNGVGFDVEAVQRAGLSVGMRSMHVRMERIGGRLTVQSQRGATVLAVHLRLSATTPNIDG